MKTKSQLPSILAGALAVALIAGSISVHAAPRKSTTFPLAQVKTDDPRDTMRSFINAMIDYKKGVETENERLKARIDDAVRTLDLSEVKILKEQSGRETAIYLKEIMDRAIEVQYKYIPSLDRDDPEYEKWKADLDSKGHRWRLAKTEITIRRVARGPRKGEYLFTPDTVARAKDWYNRVQHLDYAAGLEKGRQGTGYRPPWIEKALPNWMRDKFIGFAWWQWLGIFLAIFVGLFLKVIIRHIVSLVGRITSKSESDWDDKIVDALTGPIGYLGAAGFWFIALHALRFEGTALNVMTIILKLFFSVILIWLIYRLAGVLTDYLTYLTSKTESTLDDQLVPLLNRTLKILIVVAGVLLAIQNLGFNVMSVLAGLGIGGLAFALAAKDTVANFFGSLMILFDRPFQVGDWIVVGSADGTVEEIGFRSTRVRTFYNSVVSVPNSEVANAKVDNYGMREFRRVKTYIGVTYQTNPEALEAFLEGIKNIIKANPYTRKDYFHVVFNQYGPSSLNILVYFFLKVPNWNDELVERQNVFLEILRLAKQLGVEFAYPTQTIYHSQMEAGDAQPIDMNRLAGDAASFGKQGTNARPGGSGLFKPPHREGSTTGVGGDGDG